MASRACGRPSSGPTVANAAGWWPQQTRPASDLEIGGSPCQLCRAGRGAGQAADKRPNVSGGPANVHFYAILDAYINGR